MRKADILPDLTKGTVTLIKKYVNGVLVSKSCRYCGKHKDVKLFGKTTGNVCLECHNIVQAHNYQRKKFNA